MPAKSEAQRAYLFAHFGAAWVRRHHFDTPGPLPEHALGRQGSPGVSKPVRHKDGTKR